VTSTIIGAEVVLTSPGRNFVTLVLTTSDGLVGLGDATLNGRELAVASYLGDHLAPLLIGRDPAAIEDTWQYLYRGCYWRRGPVTMAAIAAVDVALWDIKAKAAGMPLYQLLGGASRRGIRAYGHATGRTLEELFDSVRMRLDEGFTAVRVQTGVPGLDRVYGITSGDAPASERYEPAAGLDRPEEEDWDTAAYLRHIPEVFAALRSEFGPELTLLHDAHHRLRPIEAARLGRSLEEFDLFWLEDPTPSENPAAFRTIRQHTTVPLATGEILNSIWDYRVLIEEQLIDYIRSAVTHAGGITPMRKLLDYAAQGQIRSAIHGPSDISPVGTAAALHLDFAIHNFGIQEFMAHPAQAAQVFEVGYSFADGYFTPGEAPGLGVSLDRAAAAGYPYRRAYLPVARLRDGTMHDW
jgi:mannonate dehydratase